MKKAIALLALAVALVICFAACGGGADNTPTHTHEFGEWITTKSATCTADGTQTRYCSCGEKQTEVIVALGHTFGEAVVEDKIDATYDADGSYKLVIYCTTCNEKISKETHKIPMLKHTPAEAVEENRIEATCYSEGSYDTVVYCKDCGAELERAKHTIPMIEHTPAEAVEENRINPTYEKDGSYQLVVYCSASGCGAELERTTHTLDMLVHHPGSAVVENEIAATCYAEGSYDEVVYCLDEDCGHKELSRKTVTVPMLDHTPAEAVVENLINATCTANGSYDEVVYCSAENCKTQIARTTKVIDKLDHSFVDGACTVCGEADPDYVKPDYSVGLEYTLNEGDESYSVTGLGTCTDTDIVIPATYKDLPVTSIGVSAFRDCTGLTSIKIPDGVTNIGYYAFCNCNSLVGVEFTENSELTSIGWYAFQNCTALVDIVIPNSVTNIDNAAFSRCTGLTSIVIPDSVTSMGDYVFERCSSLANVEFAGNSKLTSIGNLTFYGCTGLTNIVIPGSVTWIGSHAFYGCTGLTNIAIPNGVISIRWDAFDSCTGLTSIVIPESVTSIGDYVFKDCIDLTIIIYDGEVKQWMTLPKNSGWDDNTGDYTVYCIDGEIAKNGAVTYYNTASQGLEFTSNGDGTCYVSGIGTCTDTDIVIPSEHDGLSVVKIARNAFQRNENIRSISITEGVKIIEANAFYGCTNLISISIPSTVIEIGNKAGTGILSNCVSLERIEVANDNPKYFSSGNCLIERSTKTLLEGCKTSVIPDDGSVTTIGYKAFEGISSLEKIHIPVCVTTLMSDAFYKCTGLKEVTMPGVTSLGNTVFDNCSSLVSIVIPEGVTKIGTWVFNYCTALESITIPKSTTTIYADAFYSCSNLTSITYSGTIAQWKSISLQSNWDYYIPATYVQCSDGTVALK